MACASGREQSLIAPWPALLYLPGCGPSGAHISGHREVSTSIISWTRSSFTSELSMTMSYAPGQQGRPRHTRRRNAFTGHDARPRSSASRDWPGVGGAWDHVRSSRNRPRIRLPPWSRGGCERKPRGGLMGFQIFSLLRRRNSGVKSDRMSRGLDFLDHDGAGGKLLGRNRPWAGLPLPPCPFVGQSLLFRPWP